VKVIQTKAYIKLAVMRPSSPEHAVENEYAEEERLRELRRRNVGIGDPDIARQLKREKRRVRPTSGFAPGKLQRGRGTEKEPRSVSEFWTGKGEMPKPDTNDLRQIEARDIAYRAHASNVLTGEDAISYNNWLYHIVPSDLHDNSDTASIWQMVKNQFVNGTISKEDLMHWWDLVGMTKETALGKFKTAPSKPQSKPKSKPRPRRGKGGFPILPTWEDTHGNELLDL
jgi:hypothetical protein